SGDASFVADFVLGFDEGQALEHEWAGRNGGTVYYAPVLLRETQIQLRPDYVKPKALLDVRVRRAVAQAFDTPGVIEGLTGGRGPLRHTLSPPRAPYSPLSEKGQIQGQGDPRASAAP